MSQQPIMPPPPTPPNPAVSTQANVVAATHRSARFSDVLRSEWIKIVSLRASWIVPLVASILPVVVVVLTATFSDVNYPDLFEATFVMMFVPLVAISAFASTAVTSEYNHETIRVTYAATPQRGRVMAAKYIVSIGYAAFAFAVALATCLALGALIFSARGANDIISGAELSGLGWLVVTAAGLSGFSLAFGYFIRNSAAAVTVAAVYPLASTIIWAFVLSSQFESAAKWFPFAGAWAAVGDIDAPEGSLGRPMAFIYLVTVVALLALLAYVVEQRRDA